ncbi:MAG: hypothetical protein AB7N91_04135 [Candidatus Tectimicrobiota bacterium]
MRPPAVCVAGVILLLGLAGSSLQAQQRRPPLSQPAALPQAAAPAVPVPPPSGTGPTGLQDPTAPDARLLDLLSSAPSRAGQTPAPAEKLPRVTLRGRVLTQHTAPAAVLEIEGKFYVVRQGSELSMPGSTGGTLVLSVSVLSAEEVRIRVSPMNQIIVLR